MNADVSRASLPRMSPVRAFAAVFLAVFLFILLCSALLTFMLPETYTASARVLAPEAEHLETLQSAELLKKVSEQLGLPETWARRYGQNQPLEDQRVEDLLRRSLQIRRIPRTGLVEIRVRSSSPAECARLANEIARTVARDSTRGPMKVVEEAVTPHKPSRPNKPLNLALGAFVGIFLGTMAGGVGARLAVGFGERTTKSN